MANPLSKLSGIGDGGWQEDVMHIVRKKNDGLLPHHTALWKSKIGAELVTNNRPLRENIFLIKIFQTATELKLLWQNTAKKKMVRGQSKYIKFVLLHRWIIYKLYFHSDSMSSGEIYVVAKKHGSVCIWVTARITFQNKKKVRVKFKSIVYLQSPP